MRLDHIAYRVTDRIKTADFFQKAFGYKIQKEFPIDFGEGETVKCLSLEPPEKLPLSVDVLPWAYEGTIYHEVDGVIHDKLQRYHMPPEIFVSDGSLNSIVGKWVYERGGIGGIHHLAYQVESVEETMQEWKDKGYAEFTSDKPFECPGLTQVFTKPSALCGVIFEFIKREEFGFCAGNVKQLMVSTLDANIK